MPVPTDVVAVDDPVAVPPVMVAVKLKVSVAASTGATGVFALIEVRTSMLVAPAAKVAVLVPTADQVVPPSVDTCILVLSP